MLAWQISHNFISFFPNVRERTKLPLEKVECFTQKKKEKLLYKYRKWGVVKNIFSFYMSIYIYIYMDIQSVYKYIYLTISNRRGVFQLFVEKFVYALRSIVMVKVLSQICYRTTITQGNSAQENDDGVSDTTTTTTITSRKQGIAVYRKRKLPKVTRKEIGLQ